jgi:transposase
VLVDTGTVRRKKSIVVKIRLPFAPEFGQHSVEFVHGGRSPEKLAGEFQPSAQVIRNWVTKADCDAGRHGGGLTRAEREALADELRKKSLDSVEPGRGCGCEVECETYSLRRCQCVHGANALQ